MFTHVYEYAVRWTAQRRTFRNVVYEISAEENFGSNKKTKLLWTVYKSNPPNGWKSQCIQLLVAIIEKSSLSIFDHHKD